MPDGIAAAFYPLLAQGPRARVVSVWLLGSGIALTPLLVSADSRFARLVFSCHSACFVLKLIDLHIGAQRGLRIDFRSFLGFLANPLQLVQRRTGQERQPSARENARDYLRSLVGMLLAFAVLRWGGTVDWSAWPFLLQHAVRSGAFFVMVLFLFRQLAALMRVVGVYSINPENRPLLARTPAEFWRRYNRWMGCSCTRMCSSH